MDEQAVEGLRRIHRMAADLLGRIDQEVSRVSSTVGSVTGKAAAAPASVLSTHSTHSRHTSGAGGAFASAISQGSGAHRSSRASHASHATHASKVSLTSVGSASRGGRDGTRVHESVVDNDADTLDSDGGSALDGLDGHHLYRPDRHSAELEDSLYGSDFFSEGSITPGPYGRRFDDEDDEDEEDEDEESDNDDDHVVAPVPVPAQGPGSVGHHDKKGSSLFSAGESKLSAAYSGRHASSTTGSAPSGRPSTLSLLPVAAPLVPNPDGAVGKEGSTAGLFTGRPEDLPQAGSSSSHHHHHKTASKAPSVVTSKASTGGGADGGPPAPRASVAGASSSRHASHAASVNSWTESVTGSSRGAPRVRSSGSSLAPTVPLPAAGSSKSSHRSSGSSLMASGAP
jgi:hypothetical protein